MKKLLKCLVHNEEGVITVIVALAMTVLLTFCAFVVDFGLAYVKTSDIQNAADASVLAAGRLLPVGENDDALIAQVKQTAISYAQKNGISNLTQADVKLGDVQNGRYTTVSVNVSCVMELQFAKTFGVDTFSFSRRAKARVAPATQITGAAPLGVDYLQLQQAIADGDTEHIYLKYGAGDGEEGSYGAIDLDGVTGGGANDFDSWLSFGYEGIIDIGDDLLPVEKGNMSGPTADSLTERFYACTHYSDDGGCNASHYVLICPRVLKILVIEKIGTSYVKVKGFAAFVLESPADDSGEVLGSYIQYLDPGEIGNDIDWNNDYGLYNVGLCE